MLRPIFDRRNKLLFKARNNNNKYKELKKKRIDVRKYVKDVIKIAKNK